MQNGRKRPKIAKTAKTADFSLSHFQRRRCRGHGGGGGVAAEAAAAAAAAAATPQIPTWGESAPPSDKDRPADAFELLDLSQVQVGLSGKSVRPSKDYQGALRIGSTSLPVHCWRRPWFVGPSPAVIIRSSVASRCAHPLATARSTGLVWGATTSARTAARVPTT